MKQTNKCPFCEIPCPYDHCAWKNSDSSENKKEKKCSKKGNRDSKDQSSQKDKEN